jgi:hypothetical protein
MRLTLRVLGACALALILLGLALYLSASPLSASAASGRLVFASGVVNLGSKLTLIAALIAAFVGWQREQWRWFAALLIAAALTLFDGLLSGLTNSGVVLYFLFPAVAAALVVAYSLRMRDLAPVRS